LQFAGNTSIIYYKKTARVAATAAMMGPNEKATVGAAPDGAFVAGVVDLGADAV
jgi:hypothetical protein